MTRRPWAKGDHGERWDRGCFDQHEMIENTQESGVFSKCRAENRGEHPEEMPRSMRTEWRESSYSRERAESHLPWNDRAKGTLRKSAREQAAARLLAALLIQWENGCCHSTLSPEEEPSHPPFVLRTKRPQFHECPNETPKSLGWTIRKRLPVLKLSSRHKNQHGKNRLWRVVL